MSQYNTLNVKLPNLQLNKLKTEKKWCWSNFRSVINVIVSSNYQTNFPHNLLLTNTQTSRLI